MRVTDIILCTAAILVVGMSASSYLRKPSQSTGSEAYALVGKKWPDPAVKAGSKGTLVAMLSTTCHYCDESMPLYADIASRKDSALSFAALFPQSEQEARAHLAGYHVSADQVAAPPAAKVATGTPTLFLLDNQGIVRKVWIGKLDSTRERELRYSLGL